VEKGYFKPTTQAKLTTPKYEAFLSSGEPKRLIHIVHHCDLLLSQETQPVVDEPMGKFPNKNDSD